VESVLLRAAGNRGPHGEDVEPAGARSGPGAALEQGDAEPRKTGMWAATFQVLSAPARATGRFSKATLNFDGISKSRDEQIGCNVVSRVFQEYLGRPFMIFEIPAKFGLDPHRFTLANRLLYDVTGARLLLNNHPDLVCSRRHSTRLRVTLRLLSSIVATAMCERGMPERVRFGPSADRQ
jgi:hypothetical protein